MRKLIVTERGADTKHHYSLAHPRSGRLPMTVSLRRDYETKGDGVLWLMQHATVLQGAYSDADRAKLAEMRAMGPMPDGEVVEVEGYEGTFTVRRLGDYSNAAVLYRPLEGEGA